MIQSTRVDQHALARSCYERTSMITDDSYIVISEALSGRSSPAALGRSRVPMLKDEKLVGVILIYRQEVRPFTDKQIELVKELRRSGCYRDREHAAAQRATGSLQQQTATADVLKVISRSTFDLQMVLDTLVESATRLCDADKGTITREKNGAFFRADAYGFSANSRTI